MAQTFRAHETQSCIIPFYEHEAWTLSHPRAMVEHVSFFGKDKLFIIYSFNCLSPRVKLKSNQISKLCYENWVKDHPNASIQFPLDVDASNLLLFFEE